MFAELAQTSHRKQSSTDSYAKWDNITNIKLKTERLHQQWQEQN
jgi:hypothetical protein